MIYTLTFNPSLDYRIKIKSFSPGKLNRSEKEGIFVGGKGINVSLVLNYLGSNSVATGFVAGFTGEEIVNILRRNGIREDFIRLDEGSSRINVKLFSEHETETEINANGPKLTREKFSELCVKLDKINSDDFLIASGSTLSGTGINCYEEILKSTKSKKVILDTSGKTLLSLLKYKPFLVKPNHHELGELFGAEISTTDNAIFYAEKLLEYGAKNILVSLAENGAVFVNKKDKFHIPARKGIVKNSVGAGDSAVAGFVHKYIETGCLKSAAEFAVETGSKAAFGEIDFDCR